MYVVKGDGIETWSPRFTYYGFRYVQTEGAVPDTAVESSGLPEIINLKLVHTRNSSPETGSFYTSFDLFNRINSLILWAINSNLQSVVTDCPHREKLGWLEQTHLMGGSIHYNYDIYNLYCKLIDDMIYAQTETGLVPDIAPEYNEFTGGFRDSPEWGSASVILPWLVYKWYGDTSQIEKAWDMMSRYVDYLKSKSENNILSYGLGDWYDLGPDLPGFAQLTPAGLTATAIWYGNIVLMGRMAHILGKNEEALRYESLAEEVKDAFNEKFFDPELKVYATGSQTAMSMPLVLGLVEEYNREKVFNNLIDSIHASGNALTAGDVGFHDLVKALQDGEAGDLLFEMNARDDVPGYGYQLKKGATALTESWAALERVSNNHLMLGHIMEWFYEGLAGIGQTGKSVAYKDIFIEPQIINDIDEVAADFESPYGTIISQWQKTDNGMILHVSIPVNTTAVVNLPAAGVNDIQEGRKLIRDVEGIDVLEEKDGKVIVKMGSGEWRFVVE
jgi:alpha-L-rhamnosidase